MEDASPLTRFSRYLSGRDQVLRGIAAEIEALMDLGERERASALMWLWTLGAYEVTRTMCQAQGCFADRFYRGLAGLKTELERVRVPSTKMERVKYDRRERSVPVGSDRGADVWDAARSDLWVGDPAAPVSARGLLAGYVAVLGALTAEEVLGSHEGSFARR